MRRCIPEGRANYVDNSESQSVEKAPCWPMRAHIAVPPRTSSLFVDNRMYRMVLCVLICLFANALCCYQRLWKTWGFHNSVL